MFLGIPFDYWHIIIPVVTLVVLIPIIFLNVKKKCGFMLLAIMLLTLSLLQFWNEWAQIPNYHLYGTIQDFLANSRNDIKLFVIGMFGGSFLGFLIYSLIERFKR